MRDPDGIPLIPSMDAALEKPRLDCKPDQAPNQHMYRRNVLSWLFTSQHFAAISGVSRPPVPPACPAGACGGQVARAYIPPCREGLQPAVRLAWHSTRGSACCSPRPPGRD
jgi:hypothetical protein